MPDFGKQDPITGSYWRVRYPDDDPNAAPIEVRTTREEYEASPRDKLSGAVAVEQTLGKLLGSSPPEPPGVGADAPTIGLPQPEQSGQIPKERTVDHFLQFPDKAAAERAARRIWQAYRRVKMWEDGGDWWLCVNHPAVRTEDDLDRVEATLTQIAAHEGGVYDGFERDV